MPESDIPQPVELLTTIEEFRPGALMVHVDFLDLLERQGEPQVWETLGKLRDLLG